MKLLFDQNISHRIIQKIQEAFPEAKQIRELGLENLSDIEIWDYAKLNGFTIVTYDADFFELSNLFGIPPKIIWLRIGNKKTSEIAGLIIKRREIILDFLSNTQFKLTTCLEIND